ncbi:ShlB/FhaC/HecB family hemolysin secretion/activation protein [Novosphingobium sp.]|uniref:ShlB/FhaC/HecB family hemolysin secretion/activation protein n=1 Tax=Novosphingobium sp. TaxID=1874826 RepID=UPI003B52330E
MKKFHLVASLAGTGLCALSAGNASAQDYQHVAPRDLGTPSPAPIAQPQPPAAPVVPASAQNGQVVASLKGLVFVAGVSAFQSNGVAADGVQTSGLAPLAQADFTRKMNDLIGKPLTFAQLRDITEAVLAAYKAQGAPLVRAVVPQQNIDRGTIQVVVTEFHAGKVSAQGNRWFSDDQVLAPFHISYGDPIFPERMTRALDEDNANPFRHVELVYRPSQDPGHTDIVLMTRDRFPFRPYVSFDNSNARVLGRDRYSVGFNWGRAFGADEILSYQFSTSSDLFDGHRRSDGTQRVSFMSHSAYWSAALPWEDRLIVFGAYERTRPDIGVGLDLVGKSGQASMRYQHRLPDWGGIKQTMQAGFDFKTTNNNLDFGGTNVSANRTDVDQFLFEYSASLSDRLGIWSLDASVFGSPGGLTGNNNNAAFQPALTHSGRFDAKSHYVYARADLDRLTAFPGGGVLALKATGQLADGPLLESEQLSLGGAATMRGYEPNSINGDEGYYVSAELRTPNLPLATSARSYLAIFAEWADLSNKNPGPGEIPKSRAASTGVSAKLDWQNHVQLRFDFGVQLKRLPNQAALGQLGMVTVTFGL